MLPRHAMTDANYERVKDLLPIHGPPADNRLFIDAVLYVDQTGIPWLDLPARFGKWNAVWRGFDRWSRAGVWRRIFETAQDPRSGVADPRFNRNPRPPVRRGGQKNTDGTGDQEDQALGRSRGGFGTKAHVVVTGLGLPMRFILTAGQKSDIGQADVLLAETTPAVVIADKGTTRRRW